MSVRGPLERKRFEDLIPVADQADVAPSQVDVIIPVRRVKEHAFVLVDAGDGRPRPVVQDTRRIHKNVAVIVDYLSALQVLDLDIITALLLAPSRSYDLVSRLDILVEAVFPREIIEVRKYLFGASVHRAPIQFRLKRPCVIVRGNVTRASARTLYQQLSFFSNEAKRGENGVVRGNRGPKFSPTLSMPELTLDICSQTTSPRPLRSSRTR